MSDWKAVGQALLGSWPSQVAAWGQEAIAAYLAELEGRGLDPDRAIVALRSHPDPKFPPSAGEVFELARRDSALPTFEEAYVLIRRALKDPGPSAARRASIEERGTTFVEAGEEDTIETRAVLESLDTCHPAVRSFVERQGIARLRRLPFEDPQWGEKHLRELREAWGRHMDASDTRQIAALASGQPEDLKQLDPLSSLGLQPPRQIEAA